MLDNLFLEIYPSTIMPSGVSTGRSITGQDREAVIIGIASGLTPWTIARRLNKSRETVVAVRDAEFLEISRRKPILASLHERNALLSLCELSQRLEQNPSKFTPIELNVIAGTATDKSLSLRGDNISTLRIEHTHKLSDEDLIAFAVARSKPVHATVIMEEGKDTGPTQINDVQGILERFPQHNTLRLTSKQGDFSPGVKGDKEFIDTDKWPTVVTPPSSHFTPKEKKRRRRKRSRSISDAHRAKLRINLEKARAAKRSKTSVATVS